MNTYLVSCFIFNADLRQLNNYPIFLINFTDLLVTGPGFLLLLASQQFIQLHNHLDLKNGGILQNWMAHLRFLVRPHVYSTIVENLSWFWYICLPELLVERLSVYSNGLCSAVLAYERYVMVCKPYEKDQILTEKRRYKTYAVLSLTILFSLLLDGLIRYRTYDFSCSFGFMLIDDVVISRIVSSSVITCLFSIIPTSICIFYYFHTAIALAARKRKVGRNQNLILCFAAICLISTLTFSFGTAFRIYYSLVLKYQLQQKFYKYPVLRNMHLRFLNSNFSGFSAVTNPYLILLSQTDYREPFIKRKKKILKKLGFHNNENWKSGQIWFFTLIGRIRFIKALCLHKLNCITAKNVHGN